MNNLNLCVCPAFLNQVKDGTEKKKNSWLKATTIWKIYLAVPAKKWYIENLCVYFCHQQVFNCNIFHHGTELKH
jgi:hypothetical protein